MLHERCCLVVSDTLTVSYYYYSDHLHNAGLDVECTAVERPGVNVAAVRSLALSLGASSFAASSFHP
jgi:hypothetical protein